MPLVCGAMHYWRLDPQAWGRGLDAMRAMGMRVVDTYVPWGVHELAPRVFDFGETRPRLDVARFLRMVHERDMLAIVRPGPHINAEMTWFGLPERIVWDSACQAKTPKGNPVMLPIVPVAFPVPSYASEAFHEEVETWFEACVPVLAPLRHPDGPVVMVQVDNEGALYFRDGAYDQDYHPDSVQLFRDFLRAKYKRPSALRAAWGSPEATFSTADPPTRFDAKAPEDLARHLDWSEYQEHLLATAFERMQKKSWSSGSMAFRRCTTSRSARRRRRSTRSASTDSIDLVGLDYYHHATPAEHVVLMRRTTELASRAEGREVPAFGAEVGAGFPPFFAPHDEKDSLYTLMAALAYGLRGFNLYMAVERDRWIGAPIDPHGNPRPLADAYNELCEALDACRSFRFDGARPCGSSFRDRSGGSRARRTRSVRSRRRCSTSWARDFAKRRSKKIAAIALGGGVRSRVRARAPRAWRAVRVRGRRDARAEHGGRRVDRVCDGGRLEARCDRRAPRARETRRARHARTRRADARWIVASTRGARRRAWSRDRAARRSRASRRARRETHRRARAARRSRSIRRRRTSPCTKTTEAARDSSSS